MQLCRLEKLTETEDAFPTNRSTTSFSAWFSDIMIDTKKKKQPKWDCIDSRGLSLVCFLFFPTGEKCHRRYKHTICLLLHQYPHTQWRSINRCDHSFCKSSKLQFSWTQHLSKTNPKQTGAEVYGGSLGSPALLARGCLTSILLISVDHQIWSQGCLRRSDGELLRITADSFFLTAGSRCSTTKKKSLIS